MLNKILLLFSTDMKIEEIEEKETETPEVCENAHTKDIWGDKNIWNRKIFFNQHSKTFFVFVEVNHKKFVSK